MKTIHIIVEQGEDKGMEIHIPPEGARLGRSSKNDVVLVDPLLSRHHCRIHFKPDTGITVTDLGSSNKTMVNGVEILEQQIKIGDTIQVGDTVMKVIHDERAAGAPVAAPSVGAPEESGPKPIIATKAPVIDLGLSVSPISESSSGKRSAGGKKLGSKPLVIAAGLVVIIAVAVWLPKLMKPSDDGDSAPIAPPEVVEKTLTIDYEKVEADSSNIFRYRLMMTPDNQISIEIDDIVNNRTVREEKEVDEELIKDLIRYIEKSKFFTLKPEYTGIQPEVYNQWDLSITINKKTHSCTVLNRPEPEIFKDVREKLEVFGKHELGLWAIQFSTEKLLEMAEEEYLQGKKLFDEREVKYSNLAEAIQSFQKAEIDLDTVEPKPDFYGDTIASLRTCKQMLDEKHEELYFNAERASKLKEWENAAEQLRIIQELIPDRADERNKQARKELLDIEERIKAEQ